MRSVAIIPARGGSKRIPRKNIKPFHGKPLLAYSIQTALASELFDDVIVSTDDAEIAKIAQHYGASVPFIRPAKLADDFSTSGAVVQHAIKWLQEHGNKVRYVCTIYATAPLLQKEYLQKGFKQLQSSNAKYTFSATSMPFPIQRTFKITSDGRCEMFTKEYFSTRSQDLETAYHDAGQFYFNDLERISKDIIFGKDSIPILLPRYLVQDIDEPEDWEYAEMIYEVLQQRCRS